MAGLIGRKFFADCERRKQNVLTYSFSMEEDADKLIEDIKGRRFHSTEYSLDDGTGGKAAESIPMSAVGKNESLKVLALDDLQVISSVAIRLTASAEETGPWGL